MTDNINHDYRYLAFISYKREDEKYAKRLQRKLEGYSMPTRLCRENPDLPKYVRPIFRDKSDLAGGNLKKELEKNLQDSQYLIVICSPRSSKSEWVSKEVDCFSKSGRAQQIIPYIIAGTPNASDPDNECYPEGLRNLTGENEILGININDAGQDAAAVKVISRMFNIRFDDLWQRYERQRGRVRFAWGAFACAISIVAILIALWISHKNTLLNLAYSTLDKKNLEVEQVNLNLIRINQNLMDARDSVELSLHEIKGLNNKLLDLNGQLVIERDNLAATNRSLLLEQSHTLASNILSLVENGNGYEARRQAAKLIENYPITTDALRAINTARRSNTAIFEKFDNTVGQVDWSPNGSCFAANDWSGEIKIFDAVSGDIKAHFDADIFSDLNFIDSITLSVAGTGLKIIDTNTLLQYEIMDSTIWLNRFVSKSLADIYQNPWQVMIADRKSGSKIFPFTEDGKNHIFSALTTNTDASLIALSVDSIAYLIDNRGTIIDSKYVTGEKIAGTAVGRGSSLWASSIGNTIYVRSLKNGRETTIHVPYPMKHLEFDIYGKLYGATGDERDRNIYVWDKSGKEFRRLSGHRGSINDLAISPDGNNLISASSDRTVRMWNTGACTKPLALPNSDAFTVSRTQNKIFWNSLEKNKIIITDLHGTKQQITPISCGKVFSLACSSDAARLVTISENDTMCLWRIPEMTMIARIAPDGVLFRIDGSSARQVAFNPVNHNFITSDGYYIDGETGRLLNRFNSYATSSILQSSFSNNGNMVVLTDGGKILIYDTNNYSLLKEIDYAPHIQYVNMISFSPDNRYLAIAARGKCVIIVDVSSGSIIKVIKGYPESVDNAIYSSDGKRLFTTCDNIIKIYETTEWELIDTIDFMDYGFLNEIEPIDNGYKVICSFLFRPPLIESSPYPSTSITSH